MQQRVPRGAVLVVVPGARDDIRLRAVYDMNFTLGMCVSEQERWDGRDGVVLVSDEGDADLHVFGHWSAKDTHGVQPGYAKREIDAHSSRGNPPKPRSPRAGARRS
jgi:hypothetical protein